MELFDTLLQRGHSGWLVVATIAATGALCACVWLWRSRANERAQHEATRAKARRNELIIEAAGEGIFELDLDGRVLYASPAALRMLGYVAEEIIGLDYRTFIASAESELNLADVKRPARLTTDMKRGVGATLKRRDGRLRPVEYRLVPMIEHERTVGTLMAFADISDRVRLDLMLQDMQATAKVGAWEYLPDNDRLIWTDEVYRIHDLPVGSSLDLRRIMQLYDPADRSFRERLWSEAQQLGGDFTIDTRLQTAKGRSLWVHVIGKVERIDGHVRRVHGIIQDISERRLAEQKLRETRDFFAQTLDAMPTLVTYVNADGVVTYCNRRTTEWWKLPREQIVGRRIADLVPQETYAQFAPRMKVALQGEPQSFAATTVLDERRNEWQVHFVPEQSIEGRVRGFFSVMHDLTEMKQLEARLVQAQKMEAVGQLTGGIAHDFNNLLGVVLGNLQLLERGLHEYPAHLRKVSTAMRAAVRGADLTRRLLAFSRRQLLEPETVDLNRHVKGLDDLLRRTLGDSIDVCIMPGADLWLTRIDPSQLENAVLNLAINARDAMPQGGRLIIETFNLKVNAELCEEHPELNPGDYVCVQVTDSGVGIPKEILKNVFEPFFTTKEPGKGSGLGLSMVHGFAKQSGGTAHIESEFGLGTRVQIFLPRSAEVFAFRDETGISRVLPGGSESILVVEDDPDLRETSAATLTYLGYRIIQAQNADDALRVLTGAEQVDLLFTDIMMPGGMLGPALAQRARELRPGINVLFTTGYANTGAFSNGLGLAYSDMLPKPFRAEDLALRIRSLLDREVRVA